MNPITVTLWALMVFNQNGATDTTWTKAAHYGTQAECEAQARSDNQFERDEAIRKHSNLPNDVWKCVPRTFKVQP
jgi:hypothetical protein